MRIKICGLCRIQDIDLINELPVWAVGFNCYSESPRYVPPATLVQLRQRLRPGILGVGVFVDATETADIAALQTLAKLDAVQLHGHESPEFCRKLSGPLIKSFTLDPDLPAPDWQAYQDCVEYLLVDAAHPKLRGGTGSTIAPAVLAQWRPALPWILAGGVNPDNIAAFQQRYQPFAMDVCSGVEYAPGQKDAAKLASLFSPC